MFSRVKKATQSLYHEFKFTVIKLTLDRFGFEIVEEDAENNTCLVELDQETSVLVSIDSQGRIEFETAIVFDSSIINLKTVSSITHAACYYGFRASGISPRNQEQVKMYIAKTLQFSAVFNELIVELKTLRECLTGITSYLYYRIDQLTGSSILDLSMFDGLELSFFDPQSLGEKKEFIFQDWDAYIQAVSDGASEMNVDPTFAVQELTACAEFEKQNDILLAEVGDQILDEIIWNRRITETTEEDEYSIN